jgi:D-alanine-D-alanine ligase
MDWFGAARRCANIIREAHPTVAILVGAVSTEDQAYLSVHGRSPSADDVRRALDKLEAPATIIDVAAEPRWRDICAACDLVVVNMHGSPGEDGTIQAVLADRGVPFVGAGVEASVLALNKYTTKLIARDRGIATPDFRLAGSIGPRLPGDRMCKPVRGGSSLGIVRLSESDHDPADGDWLVEAFVHGADATVTVVEHGSRPLALPGVVLAHQRPYYDATAKLSADPDLHAKALRPASLTALLTECEDMATTMHAALGARHVSRSDFVLTDDKVYFLELNTMPGLSAISNTAVCASEAGLSHEDLIALIVAPALP